MIKNYPEDVWTKQICFYHDASSFVHKTNPADQARAPATRVWRKRNGGLKQGCTSKGKKVGSSGKVAHFMVSISYGKGVYFCEQFEKMNGPYFSDFVKRRFRKLFRGSGNPSGKMFVQDGDPSQNSAAARKEMKKLGVEVHSIPPRSPDINPIYKMYSTCSTESSEAKQLSRILPTKATRSSLRVLNLQLRTFQLNKLTKLLTLCPRECVTLSAFAVSE